jgi:hypothetical protein
MSCHRDFVSYNPIKDFSEIKLVEQLKAAMPQTKRLYFGPRWESTRWNSEILRDIAESIMDKREEDSDNWNLPDVDIDFIHTQLYVQLRQSQQEWRTECPQLGETDTEAAARAAAKMNEKLYDAAIRQRKTRVTLESNIKDEAHRFFYIEI